MQNFLRHGLCCVVTTSFWLVLVSLSSGNTMAADDSLHVDAIAEFFALHNYQELKANKAIAIGPRGAWAHSAAQPNARLAEQKALAACQSQIRGSWLGSRQKQKCVLFDSNGKRTGLAEPIGVPYGTIPAGPDAPYLQGDFWPAQSNKPRGIVLFLHGCGGVKEVKGLSWMQGWIAFYRAAGYSVALPDSFAEKRDQPSCGSPGESGINRQTRNLKLRIAQTRRTLAGLRKSYPALKIYVHGHSEGSFIAQALDEHVAGVIITGGSCGFFGTPTKVGIFDSSRFLAIAGSKDVFARDAKGGDQYQDYCRKVFRGSYLDTLFLPGVGHNPAPWRPAVATALSKLLDVEPVVLGRSKGDASAGVPTEFRSTYRQWKSHKAFAIDGAGTVGAVGELDSQFDAEEAALVKCGLETGNNPYLSVDHIYKCFLVDVNGKRPVK
jgi:hypothetical protein